MHVVCVSYFYDRPITDPLDLLDRYMTLTDWAEALIAAGGRVTVVQRFGRDATERRNGVMYHFVRDAAWRFGHPTDAARRVNAAVVALQPDLVHVNGMHFIRQAAGLRKQLPATPILVQDHAGQPPANPLSLWTYRRAIRSIDAVCFATPEQTAPWRDARILDVRIPVLELPESSSRFRLMPQEEARRHAKLRGDPLCLWVGRLNANKDPLTILRGFGKAAARLPDARLVMVYSAEDLLPEVQWWLTRHPETSARVLLLGKLPHADLEAIYNSADFFLLGSDDDGGSSYSVLEALSCGVVPLITDIPSFRAVTGAGEYGGHWPVGDADALADTLLDWHCRLAPTTREQIRAYFDAHLSFQALGQQAMAAYRRLSVVSYQLPVAGGPATDSRQPGILP
jgi:glycosyltransferase involved in cell wall biosynthesis